MLVQKYPVVSNYSVTNLLNNNSPNFRSSRMMINGGKKIVDVFIKEPHEPKKSTFKKVLDCIKKTKLYSKIRELKERFFSKAESKGITKTLSKANDKSFRKKLDSYMRGLKPGENIDPEKFLEIAEKSGATVKELEFIKTAEYPIGRKQEIIMDGKRYILETHNEKGFPNSSTKSVTRLYTAEKDVNAREYLTKNGTFEKDQHYSIRSHFDTGIKGMEWINKKPSKNALNPAA